MSNRKRVVLSLKDKVDIVECLKNGEPGRKLADKYGVGTSTISDIKKNSDTILKFYCNLDSEYESVRRKSMKKPQNELLEDAVYSWFLQKKSSGQPISGPLLCEKALDFNKKLGGSSSFVASSGWLTRFKLRHGICGIEIQEMAKTALERQQARRARLREHVRARQHALLIKSTSKQAEIALPEEAQVCQSISLLKNTNKQAEIALTEEEQVHPSMSLKNTIKRAETVLPDDGIPPKKAKSSATIRPTIPSGKTSGVRRIITVSATASAAKETTANKLTSEAWENLRQEFKKQLSQATPVKSEDAACDSLQNGQYFQSLLFLKNQFATPRPEDNSSTPETFSFVNIDTVKKEQDEEIHLFDDPISTTENMNQYDTSVYYESERSTTSTSSDYKTQVSCDDHKTDAAVEETLVQVEEKELPVKKQRVECNVHDEDVEFFNSLLPHVRTMTPCQKMMFRIKVQQMAFDIVYGSKEFMENN